MEDERSNKALAYIQVATNNHSQLLQVEAKISIDPENENNLFLITKISMHAYKLNLQCSLNFYTVGNYELEQ